MLYTRNMMDKINQKFTPAQDTKIARYMGFDKFKLLVENKNLWLANGKNFMDKSEGAIPESFFTEWETQSIEDYKTMHKLKSNIYSAYVSCWFEYERESEPMWLAYGGINNNGTRDSNGVCIITDVNKLYEFTKYIDAKIYRVKYIEYTDNLKLETELPPFYYIKQAVGDVSITHCERVFFSYKQKEYQSENEIRAVTYRNSKKDGVLATIIPEEFIDSIIINPHATEEQRKNIVDYLKKNHLERKLIDSKIICK